MKSVPHCINQIDTDDPQISNCFLEFWPSVGKKCLQNKSSSINVILSPVTFTFDISFVYNEIELCQGQIISDSFWG